MCREAVIKELRQQSERLVRAGRFTVRMYKVGLVPRHLRTTLCMLEMYVIKLRRRAVL